MNWLTSKESIKQYQEAVKNSASNDKIFEYFRREPGIREIVEGIPSSVGHAYYEKLRTKLGDEELALMWERIIENDRYGNPELVELMPHGCAASTTMRYAWNVIDMNIHGIVLDDVDIVEVGGGYGGLCRMIYAFHKPKSYTIIDLPEALNLASRYLKCYDIDARMVSCYAYNEELIDTFISNYALTELTKSVQNEYVNKLLKRSRYGYITYNSQPRNVTNQYTFDNFIAMAPGKTETYNENVKRSECQILVWKPS